MPTAITVISFILVLALIAKGIARMISILQSKPYTGQLEVWVNTKAQSVSTIVFHNKWNPNDVRLKILIVRSRVNPKLHTFTVITPDGQGMPQPIEEGGAIKYRIKTIDEITRVYADVNSKLVQVNKTTTKIEGTRYMII